MSTISDRIRAAALGPTPGVGNDPEAVAGWINDDDHTEVIFMLGMDLPGFWHSTEIERRMFLLFVAEALES